MRASSMPLSATEIYQGCRTPSINSKFSESPGTPDLGPSSSSARDLYQGFPSARGWSELSQSSTGTEDDDGVHEPPSLTGPRKNIGNIFRSWFTTPDSDAAGKKDAISEDTELQDDSAVQLPLSAGSEGTPACYKPADIERITNHFRRPIARGQAINKVYIGKFGDGTKVAVKVLPSQRWHSSNHFNQYKSMVETFAVLKHKNLLRITGYCFEESTMTLVMDYLPEGNLARFMDNSVRANWEHKPLTWEQRIQIALDVAQGLEHLHHSCNPPMTHGNLKMTNVLLDKNLNAKLGEPGCTIFSYFEGHRDVYDFGSVLWLLLTGLTPSLLKTSYLSDNDILVRTWKLPSLSLGEDSWFCSHRDVPAILISRANKFCNLQRKPGKGRERRSYSSFFDPPEVCVCPVIKIAGACTFTHSRDRPAMNLVVNDLKVCLDLAYRQRYIYSHYR
ncbi:hypothetical protein H6P81_017265 [Aristolochia fimbriata]|uniref:Protein kinase domain-containing protein n=1 Tax=Aristolochia fimbriata TaxID=158543 RepID=A0AAV7DZ05_ARIFI|nr:hypothetical protein H6P81_017265 [Aristolochia fimbriata]